MGIKMNLVFIGCVNFSYKTLEKVASFKDVRVAGIVTRKESSFNTDFCSLERIATPREIPCFFANGNNQNDMVQWIRDLHPDLIYCFGWSYLLGQEILSLPTLGTIGYHPAALPCNRGRHPIIWALALGLTSTASTFFFMDEGADSGDILSQRAVSISAADDAGTLYDKFTRVALEQIEEFTPQLVSGQFRRIPQDHSQANYWRKRSEKDGLIDWRMSARCIHNLVRALTHPYPGAHCNFEERKIKIWKTELISKNYPANLEPGKVLHTEEKAILIKCGEGALGLVDHEFPSLPAKGSYL
jgi:methionyl-tRNA formyltransferase